MEKVYRVRKGESLAGIASRLNLPLRMLCQQNGIEEVEEGDLLLLPDDVGRSVIAQPFETWPELAKRCGCPMEQLQALNGEFLFPFMKIYAPAGF